MAADSIDPPGAIGDATLAEGNDRAAPVVGTTMAGRYQVLGTLGRGGMGVVYLVHDTALDRDLALKLCFDANETTVVRQRREAKALAALDHPNVLEVYDIGDHDGLLYIAMEFVRGGTAKARFGRGQLRPWREVLDFYIEAAAGLTAAHHAGIIHRDFKPENVLVTRDGAAKVADFGLAVRESSGGSIEAPTDLSNSSDRVTRPGAAVGTPAFMAPEQLLGLDLDPRADQYSYCATLFEGLFGKRPYVARTIHARLATLALAKIAWPQDTRGVPKHILRALERGLSTDPSQRFDSMPALVEALTVRPQRRWPAAVLSVGVAAAVGATAVLQGAPSHCDLGESIGWSSETRTEVERKLDGLEPLASRRIIQNLDQLASSWNAERDRYCGETGAPVGSPATSTCLARIRNGFHARVELLRGGQPDVLRQGNTLVTNLPPADTCRNPTDGGLTVEQQEVLALLEASTAHFDVGRFLEADALAAVSYTHLTLPTT
ncbi:MAG: serine/threonine protein kinase, partial [Nannocystaceae bacterium]|nr:serine/threonine protein kinase [Nannocystaceae bacterium]